MSALSDVSCTTGTSALYCGSHHIFYCTFQNQLPPIAMTTAHSKGIHGLASSRDQLRETSHRLWSCSPTATAEPDWGSHTDRGPAVDAVVFLDALASTVPYNDGTAVIYGCCCVSLMHGSEWVPIVCHAILTATPQPCAATTSQQHRRCVQPPPGLTVDAAGLDKRRLGFLKLINAAEGFEPQEVALVALAGSCCPDEQVWTCRARLFTPRFCPTHPCHVSPWGDLKVFCLLGQCWCIGAARCLCAKPMSLPACAAQAVPKTHTLAGSCRCRMRVLGCVSVAVCVRGNGVCSGAAVRESFRPVSPAVPASTDACGAGDTFCARRPGGACIQLCTCTTVAGACRCLGRQTSCCRSAAPSTASSRASTSRPRPCCATSSSSSPAPPPTRRRRRSGRRRRRRCACGCCASAASPSGRRTSCRGRSRCATAPLCCFVCCPGASPELLRTPQLFRVALHASPSSPGLAHGHHQLIVAESAAVAVPSKNGLHSFGVMPCCST